jgi:hypothetical protein
MKNAYQKGSGKPRKRWVNAVEIDGREILRVRNWKRETLDRQVLRSHLTCERCPTYIACQQFLTLVVIQHT